MKGIVSQDIVKKAMEEVGISSMGKASIREIKKIVDIIEEKSGVRFIRMEMGIPGLPPVEIGCGQRRIFEKRNNFNSDYGKSSKAS
jgi:ribosome maturation protein Sdo1